MIRKIRDFIIGFRFKKYGHRFQRFNYKWKTILDNRHITTPQVRLVYDGSYYKTYTLVN